MLIIRSGKRQLMERIELPNHEKIRMLGEKETFKYLEILEADTIQQVETKEKIKKSISEEWENYSKPTIKQKSHQRDKHLGCLPCKILRTFLEVNKGRISTNETENKKTNDDA